MLVDMEFLLSCSTLYCELNTRREIPFLRAPMYYSLCILSATKLSKKNGRCVHVRTWNKEMFVEGLKNNGLNDANHKYASWCFDPNE